MACRHRTLTHAQFVNVPLTTRNIVSTIHPLSTRWTPTFKCSYGPLQMAENKWASLVIFNPCTWSCGVARQGASTSQNQSKQQISADMHESWGKKQYLESCFTGLGDQKIPPVLPRVTSEKISVNWKEIRT